MSEVVEAKSEGRERRQVSLAVRAKYDAAQTTPSNARHWANADGDRKSVV